MKWIISLVCLAGVLHGLAPAAAMGQEPVTIKVWQLPDPKRTDAFAQADRAVLDAFREKYPYITLKQFSGIHIEGDVMDSGPLMAIAGGVSPDVIYVNFRQSDTYIQGSFLYPMDEFLEQVDPKELKLRVAEPVWPVIKRRGPDDNTHTWALPYGMLVRALVYRKDLFQKAGLDPERPPKDWKELKEYARRMTNPEDGTYGLFLYKGASGVAWDWITFLWSAGGEAVEKQEDGSWRAVFNTDAAVDAMEFYVELLTTEWKDADGNVRHGYVTRDTDQVGRLWQEGKVGMRIMYLDEKYLGGSIDPNLYGLAPVPLGPTGERGAELNCMMMGIFSEAGISNNSGLGRRDPTAVRDAAWKYIWFYDSEEARKIRMKKMIEAGYGKMQNPVFLKRYGYDEYLKYTQPGWLETFEEALANGRPEPYGRNCQMVYKYMTYPIDICVEAAREGTLGATSAKRRVKIKQILDRGVRRTNEEMIGVLTPEERVKRNRVALVVALAVAIAFSIMLYKVWRIFTPEDDPRIHKWMVRKYARVYLLLIPALGSILLWKYVPMFMGTVMAFQDYQIVGKSSWIGLQNFADVLYDPVWWSAILKTLYYMFLFICLGFWPPIILAILLQEVSHFKVVYRVIFYLPAVVTGVIVIYLWKLLYDPSDAGGLNQILLSLGLGKLKWLDDAKLAMICCVLPTVWAGMGPGCLIYLAALKGISDDNYEAADLDGASFVQKIVYIVIPRLKALIIIQLIAVFIAASQQTDFILIMTFGGPQEATKVAGLLIWEKAYMFLKFGIATTMAWMLGIMLVGFTVLQLRKLSQMEFKAAGSET